MCMNKEIYNVIVDMFILVEWSRNVGDLFEFYYKEKLNKVWIVERCINGIKIRVIWWYLEFVL